MLFVNDITEEKSAIKRAMWIEQGVTVLLLVIGVVLITWQMRKVFKPLDKALQVVDAIAEGDLSQDVKCESRNEIARMLAGMARMRNQLRDVVQSMVNSGTTLKDLASRATRIATESTEGATRQMQVSQSVATAMTEMVSTFGEVSMANNFDPPSANKIDPPGATKNQLSRLCFSR